MLTGVIIYGLFLIAKELDETLDLSETVRTQFYDIFGIKEKPVYDCKKKENQTDEKKEKSDKTRKLYFAFGEDLDDYGDDNDSDDDFLEHRTLDEEQQQQEKELKRILKKNSRKNMGNEENVPIKQTNNANQKNTKKGLNKEIRHKHQKVGSETGATEKFNKKKIGRRKILRNCTRGREKRHKIGSNNKV